MALKTFVKISEVSNLSDARYCAGMTVNLMGFDLKKDDPAYVSPENFMELTGWLSGVEFVGEYGNASEDTIKASIRDYEIQYLQTNNPAIIPLFPDFKRILRFDMDKVTDAKEVTSIMQKAVDDVQFFLFESGNGNHYKENVVNQVLDLAKDYPVILGFNIDDKNVMDLVEKLKSKAFH